MKNSGLLKRFTYSLSVTQRNFRSAEKSRKLKKRREAQENVYKSACTARLNQERKAEEDERKRTEATLPKRRLKLKRPRSVLNVRSVDSFAKASATSRSALRKKTKHSVSHHI